MTEKELQEKNLSLNELQELCEYLEMLLNDANQIVSMVRMKIGTAMNSGNAFINFYL